MPLPCQPDHIQTNVQTDNITDGTGQLHIYFFCPYRGLRHKNRLKLVKYELASTLTVVSEQTWERKNRTTSDQSNFMMATSNPLSFCLSQHSGQNFPPLPLPLSVRRPPPHLTQCFVYLTHKSLHCEQNLYPCSHFCIAQAHDTDRYTTPWEYRSIRLQ